MVHSLHNLGPRQAPARIPAGGFPRPRPQACIDENLEVVRFLVEQGATVNQADNEGWTPLHVAASCGYLDIARWAWGWAPPPAPRGVDVEAAKRAEEELLLHDTRCWLNGGAMPEARHPRTGASALHVAAAKGYIEVMRLLLQAGYDPELRDGDGWTPLHAAAHWGVEDACRLLAEHGGGMASRPGGGRPRENRAPVGAHGDARWDPGAGAAARPSEPSLRRELSFPVEHLGSPHHSCAGGLPCWGCGTQDPHVLPLPAAPFSLQLRNQKAASQSRVPEPQVPSSSKHRRSSVCRLSSREKISLQDLSKERRPGGAGGPPIRDDDDEREEGPTESPPAETRTLNGVSSPPPPSPKGPSTSEEVPFSRRFGLQKTGSSGALGPADRQGAEGAPGAGLQRSASSSLLEGTATQAKEPRLARITPTPSWKVPEPSAPVPEPEAPGKPAVPAASTVPPADSRDRRRSYQMPVRDEESESQRKARSRLMRQSRRSTQGVTLTDLKEAEKVAGKAPEPEKSCTQSLDPSWQPRVPGVENSDGPAQRVEAPDGQGQGPQASREHRRVGKERRGPAEGEEAKPADISPESSTPKASPSPRRPRAPNPEPKPESEPDGGSFRKLYAELRVENERLREALTETTLRLAQLKVELERATQRQERFAERPALLDLERFERRALERKAAELEEELKGLSNLRADNQRLKDENAALIRVISKLSK
ncbi:PREDICTED: protein phosphatase 1 regulatory subunit 12C [Myotis davidii]|uniref:protein phosphatase 1 regulatory subunit 12C n=1 Tax=Myotis davidii TaxID=225400 RepID=UPI0007672EEA|nr:PREDICTED: protein phosphatase 1 regulatory subunit 12C [Myotis davidii]